MVSLKSLLPWLRDCMLPKSPGKWQRRYKRNRYRKCAAPASHIYVHTSSTHPATAPFGIEETI